MPARPRLKASARPLRRGPDSVQFGLSPGIGVVLEGLLPAEIALLDGLDGSADLPGLHASARDLGVDAGRVDQLLVTLARHRLLVEHPTDRARLAALSAAARHALAPDAEALAVSSAGAGDGYAQIARRAAYQVLVVGSGELPRALTAVLTAAGVGAVTTVPALPTRDVLPDLVVLAAAGAVPSRAAEPLLARGTPHLPVVSLGHRVVIGPLVVPGTGPCLRCLDLHRSDRDPAWPTVLAQLVASPSGRPEVRAETTVSAVATGLVAMLVTGRIDGRQLPVGVSVEVALPWPQVDHRRWSAHPLCRHNDPGGERTGVAIGSPPPSVAQGTMAW